MLIVDGLQRRASSQALDPFVVNVNQRICERPARRSFDGVKQAPGEAKAIVRSEAPSQSPRFVVGHRPADLIEQRFKTLKRLDGCGFVAGQATERDEL